jgi:hypothetical protein
MPPGVATSPGPRLPVFALALVHPTTALVSLLCWWILSAFELTQDTQGYHNSRAYYLQGKKRGVKHELMA